MSWLSPLTGRPLRHDTPHSLTDGVHRWPVVDSIPYLRTESEGLVALALRELDAGNEDAALVALLTDQDPWWPGPPTDLDELRHLVAHRDSLTLREAMNLLRFGPVGDYFAHRWSDPVFIAGLALLEAHWNAPATAFELAGGIGHYARELTRRGVAVTSADIVFSKCWLGRNWVAPDADYVVFDAKDSWPLGEARFDMVLCQDAFYFLPDQARVAQRLRGAMAEDGVLAIGHVHNSEVSGGALGPARGAQEWAELFPAARVYDERELRAAFTESRAPEPSGWEADAQVEAWSLVEPDCEAQTIATGIATPPEGSALRINPLIGERGPEWPSDRYAEEYGPSSTWANIAARSIPERDRRLVDLPERW